MTTIIDAGGVLEGADGQEEVKIQTNDTTVIEANATGVGLLGATPAAQQAHIADPAGGATQDAEARAAINDILVVLETFGLTATS